MEYWIWSGDGSRFWRGLGYWRDGRWRIDHGRLTVDHPSLMEVRHASQRHQIVGGGRQHLLEFGLRFVEVPELRQGSAKGDSS